MTLDIRPEDATRRGWIVPVGGAEGKARGPRVIARFAELCGGAHARIAVIPTASELEDTGERYVGIFDRYGVRADVADFRTRADCEDPALLDMLKGADGIWMTGGNQMRLATIIGGTRAQQIILERNADGAHVAGTSAGAAILSRHMIASGRSGPTPRRGHAMLAPGFGLLDSVIVDQHFRERDRLGRLLTAISFNPSLMGLGVDEDTAAFIDPDDVLTVVGSGGVTLVDPSEISEDSLAETRAGGPVRMTGIRLHILLEGDRFDLGRRRPVPRDPGHGTRTRAHKA